MIPGPVATVAWLPSAALDFTSGALQGLLGQVHAVALELLPLLLVAGLLIEAFARAPNEPRNLLAPAWRVLVVAGLLSGYGTLFGTVVRSSQSLALRLSRPQVFEEFSRALSAKVERLGADAAGPEAAANGSGLAAAVKARLASAGAELGGQLFGCLLTLVMLVALAAFAVFHELGACLLGLLYVIGPLALAGSAVSPSVGLRWFRSLVTVALWPMVSGLLLQLCAELCKSWLDSNDASAAGILGASLSVAAIAVCTPAVAAALSGGQAPNLVGAGAAAAAAVAARYLPGPDRTPKPEPEKDERKDGKEEKR